MDAGCLFFVLEDPLVHHEGCLRPDLVTPSPFLCLGRSITQEGSCVLVRPADIDRQFRDAWVPFFWARSGGPADIQAFAVAVGERCLCCLKHIKIYFKRCIHIWSQFVQREQPGAGSLDGWGWRAPEALLVSWCDRLARTLS